MSTGLLLLSFLSALLTSSVLAASSETLAEKPALNSARLLASKFSLSQYAVENMDYVIEYSLYNVGDKPAVKVTLDDRNSFPTQSFEIVKGSLNPRFERINPGENVTHSVIVRPRSYGTFNYTAAVLTYLPSEEAREARVGYTTAPGQGHIYRLKDYQRRFSSKISAWTVFLIFVALTTFVPFGVWHKLQSKYVVKAPVNAKKAQ